LLQVCYTVLDVLFLGDDLEYTIIFDWVRDMNLYSLHDCPESLDDYAVAQETVPELIWKKYKNDPVELKKREQYFAKSAKYSYLYAEVLQRPFGLGELAIVADAYWSYMYARDVFKGPFEASEAAIAKDAFCSYMYAKYILKGPFKAGEDTIAKSIYYKEVYEKFVGYKL
jgi:hypothetical protein